jgi:vacuolar-type H+-ATPase subunit F/Vma7
MATPTYTDKTRVADGLELAGKVKVDGYFVEVWTKPEHADKIMETLRDAPDGDIVQVTDEDRAKVKEAIARLEGVKDPDKISMSSGVKKAKVVRILASQETNNVG